MEAKNTEVQKLEKEKTDLKNQLAEAEKKNKELEAKKQPTEQSQAPVYTATVGVGLAAGLLEVVHKQNVVYEDGIVGKE